MSIKDVRRLDTRIVAARYDLRANRAGFVNCVFHREKSASMKLYEGAGGGYYCFGCGAHGSVIDLTMKLFDITFRQAVLRLETDFGVIPGRPSRAPGMRKLTERERLKKEIDNLWCEIRKTDQIIEENAPNSPEEAFGDVFCEAVKSLVYLEYLYNEKMEEWHGQYRRAQ